MSVRVGSYTFEEVDYDEANDVLYLGERGTADGITDEGHAWLYPDDASDQVVGLIVVHARALLERDGELRVTLPSGDVVAAGELAELVARR